MTHVKKKKKLSSQVSAVQNQTEKAKNEGKKKRKEKKRKESETMRGETERPILIVEETRVSVAVTEK